MKYPLKAAVHCTDGRIGQSTHVIVNPETETVSHVAVKDQGPPAATYLVPSRWIKDTTPELILLSRRKRAVRALERLDDTDFVQRKMRTYTQDPKVTELWPHLDEIKKVFAEKKRQAPNGGLPLKLKTKVRATDGRIGRVDEFLVDPSTWRITHMILREGLIWEGKQIMVPVSAIDRIEEDAVHLNLGKKQVKALPPPPDNG